MITNGSKSTIKSGMLKTHNFRNFLGTNVQEAKDFYNHPTTAFTFKELGNFCESDMVHKGASVLKLGFNYNEEFSTKYPMMGDKPWSVSTIYCFHLCFLQKINAIFIFNSKVVVTKNGCMMNMISKGEKCTIKSVMKRTKNFLLMVSLKQKAMRVPILRKITNEMTTIKCFSATRFAGLASRLS